MSLPTLRSLEAILVWHNNGKATVVEGWSIEHPSSENYTVYIGQILFLPDKYLILNTLDTTGQGVAGLIHLGFSFVLHIFIRK